jgi:Ca2+-binding EF-hand superfamily protein
MTVLGATCTLGATPIAQKQPQRKTPDKGALAEDEVTQLLLLMDADKDGTISKQEWMNFMSAEFDRLDKNKNGFLDVREIAQSKVRVSRFADMGK